MKSDEDCGCTWGLLDPTRLKAQLYASRFSALSYLATLHTPLTGKVGSDFAFNKWATR